MAPKSILIMRHAEKPDDVYDPGLSPTGQMRADKLSAFIPSYFGAPDFLFATAISKYSVRPYETVILAKAIHMRINATFANADYDVLADDLLKQGEIQRIDRSCLLASR